MRRALASADVGADELRSVLLVGGSSRIPLVGQMLMAALGRPMAIDVHPKHAVALGAALLSGQQARPLARAVDSAVTTVPPTVSRAGGMTTTAPATTAGARRWRRAPSPSAPRGSSR